MLRSFGSASVPAPVSSLLTSSTSVIQPYSPALLLSTIPLLKCVIFTEDYGPISLCAISPSSSSPLIRSLSFVSVENLASIFCTSSPESSFIREIAEFEIPVFSADGVNDGLSGGGKNAAMNVRQENALKLISQLKGLQDRLSDASISVKAKPEDGELEQFLRRSEAITHEFISAIRQRRQEQDREDLRMKHNKRKRGRDADQYVINTSRIEDSITHLSLRYYEALQTQLNQLDILLQRYKHRFDQKVTESKSNLLTINEDLNKLKITYYDSNERCHELQAHLPHNFPIVSPVWTSDLPVEFEPKWDCKDYHAIDPSRDINYKGEHDSVDNYHEINQETDAATRETNQLDATQVNHSKTTARTFVADKSTNNENIDSPSSIIINGGLPAVFQQYSMLINAHQPLWNELDDIDANAWVLEPSLPARRSCAERRMAISNTSSGNISAYIVLDPGRPRDIPVSLRLVGAGADVGDLRAAYQNYTTIENSVKHSDGVRFWSDNISVRDNLEICFGFALPSPATSEKADYITECGICYAHHLPSSENTATITEGSEEVTSATTVPSIMCKNPSCARSYHESCLFEWLRSLPDAKVSFDRIFGTCPYCCESISVRAKV